MTKVRSLLVFNPAADFYATALRAGFPELTVLATADRKQALQWLPSADAFVVSAPAVDAVMLAACDHLAWIHALTSGTETLTQDSRSKTIVTSSRGVHGPQMAELAMLLMMALARDLPAMLRHQSAGMWVKWPQPLLWQKQIAIIGTGHTGQALAERCTAMGMHVTGVSSSPQPRAGFERICSRAELPAVLSAADFVVLLTAHDAQTHHLVDTSFLAAMRSSAFLVNLSRGGVVNEADLLDALERRHIAGAALDVFEVEPLAAEHPLRQLPNVILTPHIGGLSDIYSRQVLPALMQNVGHMLHGDPEHLINRVR